MIGEKKRQKASRIGGLAYFRTKTHMDTVDGRNPAPADMSMTL